MFKRLSLLIILLLFVSSGLTFSQEDPSKFNFPDIAGYKTLVCDLHMHSVFSDGLVWPTVRVREAVAEGIDAIALTEHIEYRPHADDLSGDHNHAWEITAPYAEEKGVLLIRGSEITRSMPPGHFNALFIEDANALDTSDWKDAIRIANDQGAFVFWNHPGWRQEEEIPIWYSEHSWLLKNKLIQGLEIVNERSYYPLAHQWAIDSNLRIIGNSDIHDPASLFFDFCSGEHRPVTLVFAGEHSVEGIKEAMFEGRTAVYYNELLFGEEKLMEALFAASVPNPLMIHFIGGDKKPEANFINNSGFSFEMEKKNISQDGSEIETLHLKPGSNKFPNSTKTFSGTWVVKNIFVAPGKNLVVEL